MSFYNLTETSPTIKQPKGLKIRLMPHQLASICAMLELEKQGTIIVDKPDVASGLYSMVRFRLNDVNEFTESTFIIGTNAAILADKIGSGKTYMAIGLILANPVPPIHDRYIVGTDHYTIKMMSPKEAEPTNLIVVPHNLTNQWEQFIKKSTLSYLILNSIADFDVFFDIDYVSQQIPIMDCPVVIYNVCRKNRKIPKNKIDVKAKKKYGSKTIKDITAGKPIYERRMLNADKVRKVLDEKTVFILNVNRYKFFKQIFRSTKWARVIVDEMDSVGIPTMFDEFGNFNWFLTATPTAIFYKSCRRYVNKIFGNSQNLLQYFTVKNKDEFVNSSMVLPRPYVYIINTLLQRVVAAIHDLIPADVLHLINAGNMKEAVAKLNCDIDTEENIVKVLTEKINTDLHNLKKELEYLKAVIPQDPDAHQKKIEKLEVDIKRCKVKLETVKERINSINDECCFICTEPFNTPTILDCCKSVFCLKCLLSALKAGGGQCPYCRTVIKNNKEYHVISKQSENKKKKVVEVQAKNKGFVDMDKPDVLEKILTYIANNNPTPRILIFSDYSQTFDKIVKNISKANLQYALLSGVPAHITNVINEFKAGTTNILMLDSRHYGSGLNLQDAEYLILYHRMTSELETQVIGRAQRFGRKKPLKVIYLVNDSENKISKLSTNPFQLQTNDDLWMLSNPPDAGTNKNAFEEYVDDSDDEQKKDDIEEAEDDFSEEEPKKKKKAKPSNNNKKKTKPPPKNIKKKKKIVDSDSDTDDDNDDLSDLPVVKKQNKKKKKYLEV